MRALSRLFVAIILAVVGVGLVIMLTLPAQAAIQPGDTLIPLGDAQSDVRTAYRNALTHLYSGGRVHWAAAPLTPTIRPGDLIIPGGLDTTADHAVVLAEIQDKPHGCPVLRP